MNPSETISIIVAAFNAGMTLREAVTSVYAQSYSGWELILVDDGSNDDTASICDEFGRMDSRVRVIHTENRGVSAARNSGIDAATGEWLAFLDADDVLHPEFCKLMFEAVHSEKADMACCSLLRYEDGTRPFPQNPQSVEIKRTLLTGKEAVEAGFYQTHGMHPSLSGRIMNRRIWDGIRLTEHLRYEDLDIFYRLWIKATTIIFVDVPLYGYRQRKESFIHIFAPDRLDVLKVTERMEKWAEGMSEALLTAARDRRMSANFNMFLLAEKAGRKGELDKQERLRIQAECFMEIERLRRASMLNPEVRLKNRLGALVSYLGPSILRRLYRFL